jgi:hypothetical protein
MEILQKHENQIAELQEKENLYIEKCNKLEQSLSLSEQKRFEMESQLAAF